MAHVNDVIDSSRLVEFTGGLLLLHGVGAAIGPVLAGTVMDVAGPSSLMLFYAAVMGAMALYTVKRLRYFPPVPAEQKADFVAMGGGSQAVLQMDPRTLPEEGSSASLAAADEGAARGQGGQGGQGGF